MDTNIINNKKLTWLTLTAIALVFSACSNEKLEADAYGNFEAIETLVSAEVAGKLLELNIIPEKWAYDQLTFKL